ISYLAAIVHRHDSAWFQTSRAGRLDLLPGTVDVHIQVLAPAIDENRDGLEVLDYFGGCREGHSRNKDCVAFLESNRFESQMEGSGAGIHGDRMIQTDILAECLFEFFGFGPGCEPT